MYHKILSLIGLIVGAYFSNKFNSSIPFCAGIALAGLEAILHYVINANSHLQALKSITSQYNTDTINHKALLDSFKKRYF